MSLLQAEDSQFIDSPYKVYVGNISSTVSTETLKNFFSEKGKVLSAKVSRVPGTSKSSGYGFVTFSSEEEVEAAISSFNNAVSNFLQFSIIWFISNVLASIPIYAHPTSLSGPYHIMSLWLSFMHWQHSYFCLVDTVSSRAFLPCFTFCFPKQVHFFFIRTPYKCICSNILVKLQILPPMILVKVRI